MKVANCLQGGRKILVPIKPLEGKDLEGFKKPKLFNKIIDPFTPQN